MALSKITGTELLVWLLTQRNIVSEMCAFSHFISTCELGFFIMF